MKTGSFFVPRLLNKDSLQLVSGGVGPNYPFEQTPAYKPIFLNGGGGSNLHSAPTYVYGVTATVQVMPNLNIQANVAGNSVVPVTGMAVGASIGF